MGFFPFHMGIKWPSLLKIQYTELKLSCGNDPVVKNSIHSNYDLDLWPNDPKIHKVLSLPQGSHVAKFGKDSIYRTKVIVRKHVWPPARPPAIPNHIIRPISRRAYTKKQVKLNYILTNFIDQLSSLISKMTSPHWMKPGKTKLYCIILLQQ